MYNKKIFSTLILTAFLIAFSSSIGYAQNNKGGVGVGVILGEPTGLSLKSWNGDKAAFDLGLAWSFSGNNDAIHLHGDFLWHKWLNVDSGSLAFYYGIGARVIFEDDPRAGLRVPFGLTYLTEDAPLEIFFEVAPIFDVVPSTNTDVNGGVGVRFYF